MVCNYKIIVSIFTGFLLLYNNSYCQEEVVQVWGKQSGTSAYDVSRGVVTDNADNVYITGYSSGKLGEKQYGKHDIFITKYDSSGNIIWVRQWGTKEEDKAVQVIYKNSHLYICGETSGTFTNSHPGGTDAFFSKDGSNDILVGGCQHWSPCQAFLRRYDDKGNPGIVCEIIKSENDKGVCGKNISMDDPGNYYITGSTREDLYNTHQGEGDIFIAKYRNKK